MSKPHSRKVRRDDSQLTYIVEDTYSDRDRLYTQYELLRDDFNRWFDRALQLGHLSTDPETATWRALDVGSGEGLFCYELTERYPQASLVGFDRDADAIATANFAFGRDRDARFFVHDARDRLPRTITGRTGFDIIIAHLVLMHIRDAATALQHLAAALKPGGVIYLRDSPLKPLDFPHPSFQTIAAAAQGVAMKISCPDFADRHRDYLADAGFEDITGGTTTYVVGGPTEEGRRMFQNIVASFQATRQVLTERLGVISVQDFDAHMYRLTHEVTPSMICEWEVVNTIARKPL